MDIRNSEALVQRFGGWPSFHDAEIYGLRLDSGQRTDGVVRLQLDVHVFAVEGQLPGGRLNFVNHTLVCLEFDEIEDGEFTEFGPQNVLDDLLLQEVELAAGRQVQVTLSGSNGMNAAFRCSTITVIDAIPMIPGSHSVYGA